MIEALVQRLEDRLDFREVPYPSRVRIYLTCQVNAHAKGMPMQASTLVTFWYVWEAVG